MEPVYYVKPGNVIKHYKGGEYVVLAICHNESNPNELLVSYLSLSNGQPWVRELSQFNEMIIPEDTEKYGSEPRLRFEVAGECQILVNAGGTYGDFAIVALEVPDSK